MGPMGTNGDGLGYGFREPRPALRALAPIPFFPCSQVVSSDRSELEAGWRGWRAGELNTMCSQTLSADNRPCVHASTPAQTAAPSGTDQFLTSNETGQARHAPKPPGSLSSPHGPRCTSCAAQGIQGWTADLPDGRSNKVRN